MPPGDIVLESGAQEHTCRISVLAVLYTVDIRLEWQVDERPRWQCRSETTIFLIRALEPSTLLDGSDPRLLALTGSSMKTIRRSDNNNQRRFLSRLRTTREVVTPRSSSVQLVSGHNAAESN